METEEKCFLRTQKKNVQSSQSPKVPKREHQYQLLYPQTFRKMCLHSRRTPAMTRWMGKVLFTQLSSYLSITSQVFTETEKSHSPICTNMLAQ